MAVAPDARSRARTSLHAWVDVALRKGARDGDAYWREGGPRDRRARGPAVAVRRGRCLGKDVEDLIDWIDDHSTVRTDPSLLEEDGFVERAEGVEPPELRCYRFRSAMVAGVLRQEVLAGTNGKELARRYAHAMAGVYRWSPVSASAWTISRLATAAGDEEVAETIWRRVNRLEDVEAAHLRGSSSRHAGPICDAGGAGGGGGPAERPAVAARHARTQPGTRELSDAAARMARAIPGVGRADRLTEALRHLGAHPFGTVGRATRSPPWPRRRRSRLGPTTRCAPPTSTGCSECRVGVRRRQRATRRGPTPHRQGGGAWAARYRMSSAADARQCLTEMARSADGPAQQVQRSARRPASCSTRGAWRGGVDGSTAVAMLLRRAAELAKHEGGLRSEERFRKAGLQCGDDSFRRSRRFTELSRVRRRSVTFSPQFAPRRSPCVAQELIRLRRERRSSGWRSARARREASLTRSRSSRPPARHEVTANRRPRPGFAAGTSPTLPGSTTRHSRHQGAYRADRGASSSVKLRRRCRRDRRPQRAPRRRR